MRRRLLALVANLLWFLTTVPETLRFLLALHAPGRVQRRLRRRLFRRNTDCDYGRRHDFAHGDLAALPPVDYEDLVPDLVRIQAGAQNVLTSATVRLLEPTGGTTGGTKLIPYTDELRREYGRAIAPWLGRLYCRHPGLFLGRQYWCITPATVAQGDPNGPPVGFAEDAEYLGGWQAALARHLLVAPPELRLVHDPDAFAHLTLLFLLAAHDLTLLSVWHPSFLTLLLDQLPRRRAALVRDLATGDLAELPDVPSSLRTALARRLRPEPTRARELVAADLGPQADLSPLWPRLRLISCWAGPQHRPWLDRLRTAFPACLVEPKGLMATEGVTTIPWGTGHLPALRAHVLEFETDDGVVLALEDLREGQEAGVLLTTSGGLYRYRTHDRVRVGPRLGRTPHLQFLGRDNGIVDLFGEKLDERHVQRLLLALPPPVGYRFLAPCQCPGGWHYALFTGVGEAPTEAQLAQLEVGLCQNFHYAHARHLGQLGPVRSIRAAGDLAERVRYHLARSGRRSGALKLPALRRETDWAETLATS